MHAHFGSRREPHWHFGPAEAADTAARVPPSVRSAAVEEANRLERLTFTFRGLPPVTLEELQWNPRPPGQRAWTWDLNRHTWFATLGFAYWYTGDTRYVETFDRASRHWLDDNLERLGRIAWDTPFEVAARLNSWMWAYFLFRSCEDWSHASQLRFLNGLGRLAEYLYQTIEFHSPGNHILLEAKALAQCGLIFPEFEGARRWGGRGWRILEREIAAQIGSDGVHVERSTMYHRMVGGELAELWLLTHRNDDRRAELIGNAVRTMGAFEAWIDPGTGQLPLFGDAYIDDTSFRFSASAVGAAAGLVHRSVNDRLLKDYTYWVTSPPGPPESPDPGPDPASRPFPVGGYYVSRDGWSDRASVLVWDCGPTGYDRNRKHAHLDALSLTVAVRGEQLLIDPGTDEDDLRKQWFRSTRAHNTVRVDGEEQGILAARGEIWRPPLPRVSMWASCDGFDAMAGSHDGYTRLASPVRHGRTVVVRHGCYSLVIDEAQGAGHHTMEATWVTAPDSDVRAASDASGVVLTKNGVALQISARTGDGSVSPPALERGEAELECGRPVVTQLVRFAVDGNLPVSLVTLMVPDGSTPALEEVAREADGGLRVVIEGEAWRDRVFWNPAGRDLQPWGVWVTDARLLVLREGAGGSLAEALAVDATTLRDTDGEHVPGRPGGDQTGARIVRLRPSDGVSP